MMSLIFMALRLKETETITLSTSTQNVWKKKFHQMKKNEKTNKLRLCGEKEKAKKGAQLEMEYETSYLWGNEGTGKIWERAHFMMKTICWNERLMVYYLKRQSTKPNQNDSSTYRKMNICIKWLHVDWWRYIFDLFSIRPFRVMNVAYVTMRVEESTKTEEQFNQAFVCCNVSNRNEQQKKKKWMKPIVCVNISKNDEGKEKECCQRILYHHSPLSLRDDYNIFRLNVINQASS